MEHAPYLGQAEEELFKPGINCWKRPALANGSLLIDGHAYYRDLRATLMHAEKRVFIQGWDFCTEVELPADDGTSVRLSDLLLNLVERKPDLEIKILIWDSRPYYQRFREPQEQARERLSHPRIRIVFDACLPTFASFHQKLVVIDSNIAFIGGIDLTANRLDDIHHRPKNSVNEMKYGPFRPIHDVQLRLTGPLAQDLAELARENWLRATGVHLDAVRPNLNSPLKSEFKKTPVVISRTRARWRSWSEVREIESLFIDLIRSARDSIYIECQYLSSRTIADALAKKLAQKRGPEVVIITGRDHQGWWEKRTLGVLRNRQIAKLHVNDHYGRLGVYYPSLPDCEADIHVHSKLIFVDRRYVCIGSANLTNRSLGLDSECCVTFDFETNSSESVPTAWCATLLGEHLGREAQEVQDELKRTRSILKTIESYRRDENQERMLCEFMPEEEDRYARWLLNKKWADPLEGLRGQRLFYEWIGL
ncbi:MAG TPA: phospholipase D-like domain-containing protein [Bdellovibrionales bacterium]|nr:phospholipase D-like domain-containing protein [Bdellovibrionales bacterium]